MARHYGIVADSFNVGMGPRICGFKAAGTNWNLRLLPIGGSCVFGENDDSLKTLEGKRDIAIYAAGPAINLCLALGFWVPYNFLQGNYNILKIIGQGLFQGIMMIPSLLETFVNALLPSYDTIAETSIQLSQATATLTSAQFLLVVLNMGFLLNILLFVFNMLPIPALDGGQILFSALNLNQEISVKFNNWAVSFFVGWSVVYIVKEIVCFVMGVI